MLKWEFKVAGQTLTRTDRLDTYADMVGQLQASFALDSWWDDYIVIAQFVRDGIPELRVVQNGICDVPDRAIAGAGVVYVSLYAVDTGTRKTTNEIYIKIEPSGIRRDSLSPSKPSGDVWQQTLDLLGGLQGGQKGQYLQKHSDDNYDFDFVDLPTVDNTYIFDVAELKSKSLLTITRSAMTETGDEAYPYSVTYTQQLKYGKTDVITGELTPYLNTNFGIKYYKRATQQYPTALGGCLDVLYVGDNVPTGYPHRLQEIITRVGGGSGSIATSNVELYQQSNVQYIHIKTIVKFPNNPTETNITDIENYLNGEANSRGRYVKKIYVRIEVPATKEVSVL